MRNQLIPIRTDLDRFAEAISRDDAEGALTPNEAAERIGKSASQGNSYMQLLRKAVGDQAR